MAGPGWLGWLLVPTYCIPWPQRLVLVLYSICTLYLVICSYLEQYSKPCRALNKFTLFLAASTAAVLVYPVQLRIIAAVERCTFWYDSIWYLYFRDPLPTAWAILKLLLASEAAGPHSQYSGTAGRIPEIFGYACA